MKSVSYPNFTTDDVFIKPVYNLNKWLDSMRAIYAKLHFGVSFKEAFGTITDNWNEVEKQDFSAWLSYYQSNNQYKYKKANFYVNENIPGYFVPNTKIAPPPIVPDLNDTISTMSSEMQEKMEKEDKRKKIEEQRKRIIGRLHAAVKHLTSYEGHLLAGDEFEKLLTGMYDLIKQFQTVNKVSLSNQLYYDLIIRQANKLSHNGFSTSAVFLRKFAQNSSGRLDASGPIPQGSVAGVAGGVEGGNLANNAPPISSMTTPPPDELKEKSPLDELLENLETGGFTDFNSSEDEKENEDELNEVSLDDDLSVEAQMAPPMAPPSPIPASVEPMEASPTSTVDTDLNVSLPEVQEKEMAPNKDIDAIIDSALSHVTIKDVIKKIEDINSIFQNRTITRELAIVDLMLSNLGLSSYFSNLSEVVQKNHESSNYSISRLSDILMKLRGAITEDKIDMEGNIDVAPEVQKVQQNLKQQKIKEDNRKEMRKQLQDETIGEELQEKAAPTSPPIQPAQEIQNQPTPQIV